jgi:hypothetical protein
MGSTRGFVNLRTIRKAISELYRGFGPQHLNSYPETFRLGTSLSHVHVLNDPIIGTQRLAKRIAAHYRLPLRQSSLRSAACSRQLVESNHPMRTSFLLSFNFSTATSRNPSLRFWRTRWHISSCTDVVFVSQMNLRTNCLPIRRLPTSGLAPRFSTRSKRTKAIYLIIE